MARRTPLPTQHGRVCRTIKMTKVRVAIVSAVVAVAFALPSASVIAAKATTRFGAVTVFAHVPTPGHPFGVLPTDDAVYVTTSAGSPSRHNGSEVVFRYPATGGAPVASSTVQTAPDMGLFGAAEDAEGRIYVVDMSGRVLRFTPDEHTLGAAEVYATVPAPYGTLGWKSSMWMVPVFDELGNLYVTDASQGAIWRIPPNGAPAIWFQDPRLACLPPCGLNGMALGPDHKLYMPLPLGAIYRLPLTTTPPSHGQLELFHQFTVEPDARDTPLPTPIDLAFGRSGKIYVTLSSADRIAVLASSGHPLKEIVDDAFDFPVGIRFQGNSLLVANSNLLQENQAHSEILKVFVDEPGLALLHPSIPGPSATAHAHLTPPSAAGDPTNAHRRETEPDQNDTPGADHVSEPPPPRHHDVNTVSFEAPFYDPGTRVTGLDGCDATQRGICRFQFSGTAYFTHALVAVDKYYGHLSYDPITRSFTGESWDTNTGSLDGCGTGSFTIHQTDLRTSPTLVDPTSGTARLTLAWTVVPGSGTGAFRGATGSGTGYGDFDPPNDPADVPGLPNHGAYTGTITCPPHD